MHSVLLAVVIAMNEAAEASAVVEVRVDLVALFEIFGNSLFCWIISKTSFQQRPRKRDSWSSPKVDGCKQVNTASNPERLPISFDLSDQTNKDKSNSFRFFNNTNTARMHFFKNSRRSSSTLVPYQSECGIKQRETILLLLLLLLFLVEAVLL